MIQGNGTQFSIDGGLTYQTSNYFDSLCPGNYSISILGANGCSTSGVATVYAATEFIADFTFTPSVVSSFNPIIEFTNQTIGGINFNWNFGGAGVSNEENPTYNFPSGVADDYNVCLTVVNANGCQASTCYVVVVEPEFHIYVPNTFTPNGDGDNDEFFADGIGLDNVKFDLKIFDRWGQLIFESTNPDYHWDCLLYTSPSPRDA